MLWDHWDALARGHVDIAVRIRARIVRRCECARELISRIEKGVVGVNEPAQGVVLAASFNALTPRAFDVLEYASSLYLAGDIDDVVAAVGSERADLPLDSPTSDGPLAPQAPLPGLRYHLLERWVGDQ